MINIIAAMVLAQNCSDLSTGARAVCNQLWGTNRRIDSIDGKLDKIVDGQVSTLRQLDNHEMRIGSGEQIIDKVAADVDNLKGWRVEIATYIAASIAFVGILLPFLNAFLNDRTWKKRKANGDSHG